MERFRWHAALWSGILGFLVPTYFGYTLYVNKMPQNIATWGMVLALDVLGLVLAIKDGNKKPYMQIGWVLAATCIFVGAFFSESISVWGLTETISVLMCVVAVILWQTLGPKPGLVSYVTAMWISFVPLAMDYLKEPQSSIAWLWQLTIVSCLLAVVGAEKKDFTNTFVPWGCIGLNVVMWYLCL